VTAEADRREHQAIRESLTLLRAGMVTEAAQMLAAALVVIEDLRRTATEDGAS